MNDVSLPGNAARAKQYLPFLQRGGKLLAQVESVSSGGSQHMLFGVWGFAGASLSMARVNRFRRGLNTYPAAFDYEWVKVNAVCHSTAYNGKSMPTDLACICLLPC